MNYTWSGRAYGPKDDCALEVYMKNCSWTAKERCWVDRIVQYSRMANTIDEFARRLKKTNLINI